jgi:hypothetical protein
MLGVSNETQLSEAHWQTLPSRVELPNELAAVPSASTREGAKADCQRRYARMLVHSPAIAESDDVCHACFTKDISRNGVGFYSPVNLLPKKALRLWLPSGNIFNLRVTRCRRLAERCYEVGTRFVGAG